MNCVLSPPRAPSELLRLDSFRTLSRLLLVVEFKPWFGREARCSEPDQAYRILWECFSLGAPLWTLLNLLSPPYHHIAFEFELSMDERVAFFTKFIERVRLLEIQGLLPYGEVLRVDDMFGRSNAGFARVLKTVQSILCALQESYPGLFVVPYRSQYQRQAFVQNLLDTEQAHVCSLGMVAESVMMMSETTGLIDPGLECLLVNRTYLREYHDRVLSSLEKVVTAPWLENWASIFNSDHITFKTRTVSAYRSICVNYLPMFEFLQDQLQLLEPALKIHAQALLNILSHLPSRISEYCSFLTAILHVSSPLECTPPCSAGMSSSTLPPALCKQLDVLLIDNFDSFTWNLYQQLCLLGAEVTVIRNDAISPELFPELKLNSLIISPGPGHPKTDSGISRDAIEFFKGKVPVLGVCMGLECMVDLFGGEIAYAGEIMHGKVSRILHDERGCFKGIQQGIKSTRYHSLSAAHTTLPAELAITATTEDSGVIMGVRHRQYTLEAVQYHPESILSEGGDALVRNFLALRGGTWEENPESRVTDSSLPPFEAKGGGGKKIPSVLEKIYHQRLADVTQAQATAGSTMADLETLYRLNVAPPLIPLLPRLTSRPALFAEVKRASPSKGPIAPNISPASQALTYALAGAHVVSVLTEPKWFLGSLQDMLHARLSVATLPDRPAILRKDFIFSRYQVLESRIWGADTILLIVGLLPEVALRDLYAYSLELGMEPLVEVNNAREMDLALSLPAKVIGVNNRNLHDFRVDMDTTTRLVDMAKGKDVVLCALSGITSAADVSRYAGQGVDGVLIGETLMRAKDPAAFIRQLLPPPPPSPTQLSPPLVKICGVRTKDEALAIADAGADMLGLMFVESSKRHVTLDTAREICASIRALRFSRPPPPPPRLLDNAPWFASHAARLTSFPLVVGVFQNQPLGEILHAVSACQLDAVQLHGSEPVEWARQIPVPVIKAFHTEEGITRAGYHHFILLDSLRDDGSGVSGGSGKVVDWEFARRVSEENKLPIILAGGLNPENVGAGVEKVRPWAVDVSGGVEREDGEGKDVDKVREFVRRAKGLSVE